MPWLQINITTNSQHIDKVEHVLLGLGASTVTLRDAADQPILEPQPGTTPVWQQAIITGLFEHGHNDSQLVQRIDAALADIEHTSSSELLEDQDWTRSWMQHYKPMQFGERLWVCPQHIEPPDGNAINLRLDPGLAFGTGTHPTTALCLAWLDKHIDNQDSVLDYGCGSGILAIAALLLGANNATGVDIDPQALQASLSNAQNNEVVERLQLYSPEQCPKRTYAIVMANILSGPLQQLAATMAGFTEAGGHIVLSGILREQAEDILHSYRPWFAMSPPQYQDDWVLLTGTRKP